MKHAKCLAELKKREKDVTQSVRKADGFEKQLLIMEEDNKVLKGLLDKQQGFKEVENTVG
jgi:hypothetical protein